MVISANTSAREYLRVSVDRSGRQRSTQEQHVDNERAASELGWVLGGPYVDCGSASRYARTARADFGALLDDLRIGRFGAEVLVLWESSRGSRRVGEWVELIELCEQRAVRIFVTTHQRVYDPGNPRDRRSLLEDAVDSEYESGKASSRIRRAAAANAAAGPRTGGCRLATSGCTTRRRGSWPASSRTRSKRSTSVATSSSRSITSFASTRPCASSAASSGDFSPVAISN